MAHPPGFDPMPTRTHLNVRNSGAAFSLPRVGDLQMDLPPGDSLVPIAYLHALGGHPATCDAIASGQLKAVCLAHTFADDPERKPGNKQGACHFCGHTADSYAAELAKPAPVVASAAPVIAVAPAAPILESKV